MKSNHAAIGLLIAITASWGLTFPLKQIALQSISPGVFVLIRFLFASLLMFPFVIRSIKHTSPFILVSGMILGLFNCGIYLFQNIGIQLTPISHAAFITESSVVMVPLLAPLWRLGFPTAINLFAAILCIIGIYVLSGATITHFNQGDAWILACAFCNALSILTIQYVSKRTEQYMLLTFYMIFFTSSFMMLFVKHHLVITAWPLSVWYALLFCAIFATVLALYIQMRYQQCVSATQAAIIFTLEPVFAVLFAIIFFTKHYPMLTYVGAIIVIISVLLPIMADFRKSTS